MRAVGGFEAIFDECLRCKWLGTVFDERSLTISLCSFGKIRRILS
jgi:hypothetical protein